MKGNYNFSTKIKIVYLVSQKSRNFSFLNFLSCECENSGLFYEGHDQRVVEVLQRLRPDPQRPHALDARQVDGGQLVDPDPVSDDPERSFFVAAGTGDKLTLTLKC